MTLIDKDLIATVIIEYMKGSGDNSLAIVSKGQVLIREEHEGDINSVTSKGNLLVSGGDDEKVIIWKIVN